MGLLLLDPASHKHKGSTENIGDLIIKMHTEKLLEAANVTDYRWIDYDSSFSRRDTVIVAGANVFGEIFSGAGSSVWHPSIFKHIHQRCKNIIPLGVGWWSYQRGPSRLTESYYNWLLAGKNSVISVRDEYTLGKFHTMNFHNTLLTGCPSMCRHKSFACKIPDSVLVTLTNYRKDVRRDLVLIKAIYDRFENLYFFPQGSTDLAYLSHLLDILNEKDSRFKVIPRDFRFLNEFIQSNNIIHVGTRLHMGMQFLYYSRPTLCIEVDNRAIEMKKTFPHLPILDIYSLSRFIGLDHSFDFAPPTGTQQRFLEFLTIALG